MKFTASQVALHQAKFQPKGSQKPFEGTPEPLEGPLAVKIWKDCDSRWPRWKIIQARRDKRSTIALGSHDQTIFADKGRVFALELKADNGKLSINQIIWHKEMEMLGHIVHEVRTFEQYLSIVNCQ